jgi:hypothetical protein
MQKANNMTRKELLILQKKIDKNKELLKKRFLFTQLVSDTIKIILKKSPTDDDTVLCFYTVEDFIYQIKEAVEVIEKR